MSTIDITRAHTLPKDEAKLKAEEVAKSLESKFNLSWRWDADSIRFEAPGGPAKGTKGEISVTDKAVRVQIDLPFLLKMLKGTIESKVHEKLAQIL